MEHPDHDVVSLMLHLLYFTLSYVQGDKLNKVFWEDQKVWYKCIDERNEGIILEQAKPGQEQFGDKKKTSLDYQCLETGEFNLPIKNFPGCAPKRKDLFCFLLGKPCG